MQEGVSRFEEEPQIYTSGKNPDAKEPTLEKEAPPEAQEQLSKKEMRWKEAEQNIEKYGGIEDGIKETIVGLNVFDVETVNSCEGHFNHGRIAPWVSIEKWESKPRERYVGQKEFEQQVYERLGVVELNKNYSECLKAHDEMAAGFLPEGQVEFNNISESDRKRMAELDEEIEKKYGITPEVTKRWMEAGMQAEKEIEQAGKDGQLQETEEYKKWNAENDAMKDKVQELLDEFYKDRKVSENNKVVIDKDASGLWCIHNGGEDYYDVTRKQEDIPDAYKKHYQEILDGKNSKEEQEEIEKRIEDYRAEFQAFSAFMKEKHFSGQNPEKEVLQDNKEVAWQKKMEEIEGAADGMGLGIDKKVKETIVGLNFLGFPTSQSCEGHMRWGTPNPWVEIGMPDEPKQFIGQDKIYEEVAAKYGITKEEAERSFPGKGKQAWLEAQKTISKQGETPEHKQWREENKKLKKEAGKLLKKFYKGRKVLPYVQLKIEGNPEGDFEIKNGSSKDQPYSFLKKKLSKEQMDARKKRMAKCQQEMRDFGKFLKEEYFAE